MTTLTTAELATESVELLPDRETLAALIYMPVNIDVNVTNITALNGAFALNLGGAGSSANAWAGQVIDVLNVNH